jgi:hypothetical protein
VLFRSVRVEADELTAYSEGLFTDSDLDILINLSQNNVLLDLIDKAPRYFRKTVLISLKASTRTYDVYTDFALVKARFIGFESILHNKTGDPALPLLEVDPDQEGEYVLVGQTESDPMVWGYEGHGVIFISPMVSAAATSRLKGYYFEFLADMVEATECALPVIAHQLVILDVLKQWAIREEASINNIELRYQALLFSVGRQLSMISMFKEAGPKPSIREVLKKQYEYTGVKAD